MAKVNRHVELEESHIIAIRNKLGAGTSLSYILNELLFHLHNVLQEEDLNVSLLLKDAAERSKESL
jgi:phosphoribosyl-ATP pyrophosphohydrolase